LPAFLWSIYTVGGLALCAYNDTQIKNDHSNTPTPELSLTFCKVRPVDVWLVDILSKAVTNALRWCIQLEGHISGRRCIRPHLKDDLQRYPLTIFYSRFTNIKLIWKKKHWPFTNCVFDYITLLFVCLTIVVIVIRKVLFVLTQVNISGKYAMYKTGYKNKLPVRAIAEGYVLPNISTI